MQISSHMDTEIPQERAIWGSEEIFRRSVTWASPEKGMWNPGRAPYAGSRPYAYLYSSEIRGLASGRVHQRQERDSHCERVFWSTEEFYRRRVLGKRLPCEYGREEWRGDSQIYQTAGKGRSKSRPNEVVLGKQPPPLRWPKVYHRFERFTYYKPPAMPEVAD